MIEVWAVNYRDEYGEKRVKVFDSQTAAQKWANHPPSGVKIIGKIWEL